MSFHFVSSFQLSVSTCRKISTNSHVLIRISFGNDRNSTGKSSSILGFSISPNKQIKKQTKKQTKETKKERRGNNSSNNK